MPREPGSTAYPQLLVILGVVVGGVVVLLYGLFGHPAGNRTVYLVLGGVGTIASAVIVVQFVRYVVRNKHLPRWK